MFQRYSRMLFVLLPCLFVEQGTCQLLPCGLMLRPTLAAIKDCFLSKFLGDAVTASSSKDEDRWISKQADNKEFKAMLNDIVMSCGKHLLKDVVGNALASVASSLIPTEDGPFDALVCDLLKSMRTGDFGQMTVLQIDTCLTTAEKAIDKSCADKLPGGASKLELLKSVMTAVTGRGESTNEMTEAISSAYKACQLKGRSAATCFGFASMVYSCKAVCQVAGCQLKSYADQGGEDCKAAVKTGCSAAFAGTDKLCEELAKASDVGLTPPACKPDCGGAQAVATLTASVLAAVLFAAVY